VIVRPVRPEEFELLGALTVAAYHALPGHPPDPEYDDELRDTAAKLAAGCEVPVAVLPGATLDRVVGGVCFVPGRGNPFCEFEDPDAAGFRHLAVDPAVQRSGAGVALTRWCMARAVELGRARVLIHSGVWMTGAHRLYERLGFERVPEMDWVPVPGIELLGFRKELGER
jgi:GNAT superfamily N-acetyltransferase